MLKNTPRSYGSVARILHWLTALLILTELPLGLIANRGGFDIDRKVQLFSLHKTLGVAIFAVALIRILWALSQPRPASLHPERRAETLLAETVHWVLYAALVMVPLTGWIQHAATEGFSQILWPLSQGLPFIPKSESLAAAMGLAHQTFAWMLVGSLILHIAGAIKHAAIDRDATLSRMVRGEHAGPGHHGHRAAPAAAALAIYAAGAGIAFAMIPPSEAPVQRLEAVASDWQVTEGSLGFTVRQMGTDVQGSFADWTAAIAFDEASGTGQVTVTIAMPSVTLGTVSEQAKGADFFDVAHHATATFTADIQPEGTAFIARGTLNLRGAEAPVQMPFTLTIEDGIATMQGSATLDRRDYAIGQSYADEATVGFPVEVQVNLTARR
ncbi:cytochrome b/b6 domain-containing protein [Cereibacter sp. SYSU M97828]|nr:cytochrome b/b6 domain-containing protein [Cereibacter flavus]